MTRFVALREAGRWERGRWVVDHSERCEHRHLTEASAVDCLSKWTPRADGARRVWCRDYARDCWGTILSVGPDGERVACVRRPDRFRETTGTAESVAWTWRYWDGDPASWPAPDYPVEMEFVCGEYAITFMATRHVGASYTEGVAWGLHYFVAATSPAELVAIQARTRKEPPNPDGGGVLVIGPWGRR